MLEFGQTLPTEVVTTFCAFIVEKKEDTVLLMFEAPLERNQWIMVLFFIATHLNLVVSKAAVLCLFFFTVNLPTILVLFIFNVSTGTSTCVLGRRLIDGESRYVASCFSILVDVKVG